jgi:hypothetical protein
MSTRTRNRRRSSGLIDHARDAVAYPIEAARRRPYLSVGSLLALALAGYVVVSVFPELHRYIHVKRM